MILVVLPSSVIVALMFAVISLAGAALLTAVREAHHCTVCAVASWQWGFSAGQVKQHVFICMLLVCYPNTPVKCLHTIKITLVAPVMP
jgi:hypothetical protein